MIDVGSVVVCIDDSGIRKNFRFNSSIYVLQAPTKGSIYTVREVYISPFEYEGVGVLLEEIVNQVIQEAVIYGVEPFEPGFKIRRFRPVKKTDISVFEKMLTPVDELV